MRFSLALLLLPSLALSQVLTSTTSTTTSETSSPTPSFNSPARVAQEDEFDDSQKVPTLLDATGTPMDADDAAAGTKIPGGNGNGGESEGSRLGMSSVGALVVFAAAWVWM